jgi:hypothetical protein
MQLREMDTTGHLQEGMPSKNDTAASNVTNKCGRTGCGPPVQNGIECSNCNLWFHFKCTGLKQEQWTLLAASEEPFVCRSCIFEESRAPHHSDALFRAMPWKAPFDSVQMKDAEAQSDAEEATNPLLRKMDTEYKSLFKTLSEQVSVTAEAVRNLQVSLTDIKQELDSLNEYMALSLPGPAAAREALKISSGQIREVANELKDKTLRDGRIIVWGYFKPTMNPTDFAKSILACCLPEQQCNAIIATWLRGKKSGSIHGLMVYLPKNLQPSAILEKSTAITASHSDVRGVSLDRPVHGRRENAVTKGSTHNLDDSKLHKNPLVVLKVTGFPHCDSSFEDSFASLNSLPLSNSTPNKGISSNMSVTDDIASQATWSIPEPSSLFPHVAPSTDVHEKPVIWKPLITRHPNQGLLGGPRKFHPFFPSGQPQSKPPDKVVRRSKCKNLNNRLLERPQGSSLTLTPTANYPQQDAAHHLNQITPLLTLLLLSLAARN